MSSAPHSSGEDVALLRELPLLGETWSTPAIVETSDGPLLVAVDRAGEVKAFRGSSLTEAWRHDLGCEITSSPTVADVDGDGEEEILLATHGGDLLVISGQGEIKSRIALGETIRSTPAVADLDGDGRPEIVLSTYGPYGVALRWTGEILWRRRLPKHLFIAGTKRGSVSSPLVADVDLDGAVEIVFGTRSARLFCLEGATGRVKWFKTLRYDPDSSPSFVVKDGRPLVIFGGGEHTGGQGDNAIIALDGRDGAEVWRAPMGGGVDSSPTIARMRDGSTLAFACVLARPGCVAVNVATGQLVWRAAFGPTSTCEHGHDFQCRRQGGRTYFTEDALCRSYTTPTLMESEAGEPLVAVGSNNGEFVILHAATGAIRYEEATSGMVRGSLVFGDLDQDGRAELVVPSGDRLRVYRTPFRGEPVRMFKARPDHLGAAVPSPPALAARPRRPPRTMAAKMFWHFVVLDAARHLLLKLDEKVLRGLGVRLFAHGY